MKERFRTDWVRAFGPASTGQLASQAFAGCRLGLPPPVTCMIIVSVEQRVKRPMMKTMACSNAECARDQALAGLDCSLVADCKRRLLDIRRSDSS